MTVIFPPSGAATGGPAGGGRPAVSPGPSIPVPTVTVGGLGEALVVPDALQLELAVEASDRTVVLALSAARSVMAEVRRVVSEAGVAAADQRTSGLNVWPRHDDRTGSARGYTATESLSVTLRQPDLVDVALSGAADVAGDHLRVNGLGLTVTEPAAAQDAARRLALEEARRRAELYATELGCRLDALLELVEGGGGRANAYITAARASRDSSIEPGTEVIAVHVTATWTLVRDRSRARTQPPGDQPPTNQPPTDQPSTDQPPTQQ